MHKLGNYKTALVAPWLVELRHYVRVLKKALYGKILTFLKVNLDLFILIYHWIKVEFKIISVNA